MEHQLHKALLQLVEVEAPPVALVDPQGVVAVEVEPEEDGLRLLFQ